MSFREISAWVMGALMCATGANYLKAYLVATQAQEFGHRCQAHVHWLPPAGLASILRTIHGTGGFV